MRQKIFIMLGRYGDILNILPTIKNEADKNPKQKPYLVVAKDYYSITNGITYLNKIKFEGDFRFVNVARRLVEQNYLNLDIKNCSIYGKDYHIEKKTWNYQRESWRLSETNLIWGEHQIEFDNRDRDREKKFIDRLNIDKNKKIILLSLKGTSSPLECANELKEYLINNIPFDYQIVDISEERAEFIYDLIGLYEIAHSLISIDTSTLHLANAVPNLPVISLITDAKDYWHKSFWRPNHILRLDYSEVSANHKTILDYAKHGWLSKRKTIRMVTSSKVNDGDTIRRIDTAKKTWDRENKLTKGMWEFYNYRNEADSPPKIKNMINKIAEMSNEDDILAICNSDIYFVPFITGEIIDKIKYESIYFHRHDFYYKIEEPNLTENKVMEGKWYPGSDMFVFTKRWWERNKDLYPDMYYGREAWDMVMRNLIKMTKGVEIHNAIYHEKHTSYWEHNKSDNYNIQNRSLGKYWLEQYGGHWNDWKFKNLNYKRG